MWQAISENIASTLGDTFVIESTRSVGGGSINSAYVINDDQRAYFVKTNSATRLSMFEAEFEGLEEISRSNTIKVPQPLCVGKSAGSAYIVMEHLPIHGTHGHGSRGGSNASRGV